jgi:hypothetical protein
LVTLHIEHRITDLDTWVDAFSRFEEVRRKAGVLSHRVRQPLDDDTYVYIDLSFETAERAATFRTFLEENVWASRTASPALAGAPKARILTDVEAA